eukprot:338558-Pelagomonas_calceolata.AAC.1
MSGAEAKCKRTHLSLCMHGHTRTIYDRSYIRAPRQHDHRKGKQAQQACFFVGEACTPCMHKRTRTCKPNQTQVQGYVTHTYTHTKGPAVAPRSGLLLGDDCGGCRSIRSGDMAAGATGMPLASGCIVLFCGKPAGGAAEPIAGASN